MSLQVKRIPLSAIQFSAQNPRRDAAEDPDLESLAASMGDERNPTLAQPPVVEDLGNGQYRVIGGERRVRAARLLAWSSLDCVVREQLEPIQAHRLRLLENLHRKELHPLDQAAALKIAWYSANAEAMGLAEQARTILEQDHTPQDSLAALERLLQAHGFQTNHPAVSWDDVLDSLGIALNRERRKKLLQVLGVAPEVQEKARQLDMTEASLRALAKMDEQAQARLVEEIAEDPDLARKVRRISHAVRQHHYALDDAIAEARGEMPDEAGENRSDPEQVAYVEDEAVGDLVVELMEAAHQFQNALSRLVEAAQDRPLAELEDPWGGYALETLQKLTTTIKRVTNHVV